MENNMLMRGLAFGISLILIINTLSFTVGAIPSIFNNSDVFVGTGDSYVVNATVTDDEGVDSVWVEYWFDGGGKTNVSMTNTAGNCWANDTIGYENTSSVYSFTIEEDAIMEGTSGTYLVNETNTTQYSFLNGTFDSTKFDDNIDAVVLNNSYSGNFTSEVFDGGSTVSWNNILWLSNGIGELPNNRQSENKPDGVDMTDNEVLFHFNNQSEHNENDTYLHDFSGSGHYGENSALLVSNGKLAGGVEFDGTSDHRIFIKDGMSDFWDDAGNWSVVMWIYARDASGNIIGKRDDCIPWIWIDSGYSVGFSSYYGSMSGSHPSYDVDPDQWTHLVMTRNQSEIRIYKNGVLHTDLNSSTSQNGNNGGGDLQIGACGSDGSRLNGLIDELAFFSRTLSTDEIKDVYKRSLMHLNVSVSSCDDPNCVGETWVDIDDSSPQSLSVPNNRYFQYNFAFETENLSYSPELYNVTIRYSEPDTIPPEISSVVADPDPQDARWYVNISCDVDDNIGVDEVWVNITYPDSTYHNKTMLGGSYYYNATYALVGTYYYFIWANDTNGNSNTSSVYDFVIQQDSTPPASITNLQNVTEATVINWMWTNPTDFDFNYTIVYLNGTWMTNTSNPFYSATGLDPDVYYEIGTRTVDYAGNINTTWVNQTSKTIDLRVHNIDTGLNYSTIQEAIDTTETVDGHTILVDPGTYTENVDVYKSLTIRSTSGNSSDTIVQAEDSNEHVFEVTADYVNISGFTVQYATELGLSGIYLTYADHCNLSNNNATNNYYGIYLYSSSNNTIVNNVASSNDENGIYLYMSSDNNTIVNNQGNSSGHNGIYLYMSSDKNTIANNIFNSNGINNIYVRESNDNVIANNTVNDSEWGICLYISCNNTTIVNNTAMDNSPWGIWVGVSCYSNTIVDNIATNNDYGIILRDTIDSIIADNNATNNNYGIYLYGSSCNNTIVNNNASSNNNYGIAVRGSSNNTIANNNVISNIDGIFIYDSSSNNTVMDNNATNNNCGIAVRGSSNNTIANNTASSNNYYGIYLYQSSCSNTILNNNASLNNDYGIYLQSSSNNTIYNNYFNNMDNALDDGNNTWNIPKTSGTNIIGGAYLGGNFWSDYNGTDLDNDGIGDTELPYGPGDYLPLTGFLDVNQSLQDRGFPIRHALGGDWGAAQNFTPTLSTLTGVDIYLRKFGTPDFDLVVELREDAIDGALLDTITFSPGDIAGSWNYVNVDFDDVAVTPGTDYFIKLPSGTGSNSYGYEWGYCFGNVYDDGAFWFTRDGGGLWRPLPTMYEFTFRTYGYN